MKRLSYRPDDSTKMYVWALILPLLLSMVLALFLQGAERDGDENFLIASQPWFVVMMRLASAGLLIALFFVYNRVNRISGWTATGIKNKASPLKVVLCLILAGGLVWFSSPFIEMISVGLSQIGVTVKTGLDLPLTNGWWYILAIVLVGIIPAVVEEFIFRGVILNGLRKWDKWPAILISALMFCLMHGSVVQFTYTLILGVVLGWVMWETRALWLTILMHFINNAVVITAMFITEQQGIPNVLPTALSTADILYAVGMMLVAVALVIAVFILIKRLKSKETDAVISSTGKSEQTVVQSVSQLPEEAETVAENKNKNLLLLLTGICLAIFITIISIV